MATKRSNADRICVELVKAGLAKNESWVPINVAAAELMFADTRLQTNAMIFAGVHPQAIHFLEQAPVLAVGLVGSNNTLPQNRYRAAARTAELLKSTPRLRDVLKARGFAKQLRAIDAKALCESHKVALTWLSKINPSVLAQNIPSDRDEQAEFLLGVQSWCDDFIRRGRDPAVAHIEWIMLNARFVVTSLGLLTIADFLFACPDRFNPSWTYARANELAGQWHYELQAAGALERLGFQIGHSMDVEADYWPFPDRVAVGGLDVVALRSGRAVFEEGKAMHHCVASYAADIYQNRSRIFSVRDGEKRLATFELKAVDRNDKPYRGKWVMIWEPYQLQGPANGAVSERVREAVFKFVELHERVRVGPGGTELPDPIFKIIKPGYFRGGGARGERFYVLRPGGEVDVREYAMARPGWRNARLFIDDVPIGEIQNFQLGST